jgi:hypothetical protein
MLVKDMDTATTKGTPKRLTIFGPEPPIAQSIPDTTPGITANQLKHGQVHAPYMKPTKISSGFITI